MLNARSTVSARVSRDWRHFDSEYLIRNEREKSHLARKVVDLFGQADWLSQRAFNRQVSEARPKCSFSSTSLE